MKIERPELLLMSRARKQRFPGVELRHHTARGPHVQCGLWVEHVGAQHLGGQVPQRFLAVGIEAQPEIAIGEHEQLIRLEAPMHHFR